MNTDLPAGYRWATADEAERWDTIPGAIVVPRTTDASGQPYTQGEADIAVPLDLAAIHRQLDWMRKALDTEDDVS